MGPLDGVFDGPVEQFRIRLPVTTTRGGHTLAIRVRDAAGNLGVVKRRFRLLRQALERAVDSFPSQSPSTWRKRFWRSVAAALILIALFFFFQPHLLSGHAVLGWDAVVHWLGLVTGADAYAHGEIPLWSPFYRGDAGRRRSGNRCLLSDNWLTYLVVRLSGNAFW